MLKIKIITVGNLKESAMREICAEYAKRLSSYCSLEIVELRESRLPDSPSASQISAALSEECALISAQIPKNSICVPLCVEGKQLSSEELAEKIDSYQSRSSCICFIIGSSYGLSDEIKSRADLKLSFSKMTFPHQLMRVILLEQTYRAFMINTGRTYHK